MNNLIDDVRVFVEKDCERLVRKIKEFHALGRKRGNSLSFSKVFDLNEGRVAFKESYLSHQIQMEKDSKLVPSRIEVEVKDKGQNIVELTHTFVL